MTLIFTPLNHKNKIKKINKKNLKRLSVLRLNLGSDSYKINKHNKNPSQCNGSMFKDLYYVYIIVHFGQCGQKRKIVLFLYTVFHINLSELTKNPGKINILLRNPRPL